MRVPSTLSFAVASCLCFGCSDGDSVHQPGASVGASDMTPPDGSRATPTGDAEPSSTTADTTGDAPPGDPPPSSDPLMPSGDPPMPSGDPLMPSGDPLMPSGDPLMPSGDPPMPSAMGADDPEGPVGPSTADPDVNPPDDMVPSEPNEPPAADTSTPCEVGDASGNPNRLCIKGKNYYLNGINVAWDQWGQDLTNYDAASFEAMFATLEASGSNAVRWWWFPTGAEQITYSGELAQPLAQNIFDNLDEAFDTAAQHGVLIMPVLLSFDIDSGGRVNLVTNEAATDAFVTNVVTPLVQRYDAHPGLALWEIMNEGDWLLTEEGGSVTVADYQRFHAKVAAGIHAAAPNALVTTGSASFKYLEGNNNILSDAALQQAAGGDVLAYLDVYQTHYYSWMHGEGWSYEPWIRTSSEWQADGKPVLIGEFPCKGEEGRWSSMDMHVESVNQGYAGSFCWAYHDNREDSEGTWSDAQPAVEAIAAQIPGAISGQ